jgi:hypothetical protein
MPAGYEHMRDKFKKDGMKDEEAKAKAAAIWNSKHPNNPVTKKHEGVEDEPAKIMIDDELL